MRLFLTVGLVSVNLLLFFFVVRFLSRQEERQRAAGLLPDDFAHRRPKDYTPKQRLWALLIGIFLLLAAALTLGFGKSLWICYLFFPIILTFWLVLIKFGNRLK
ncbi:MAG: hypothetical protein Q8N84_00595 [bacterium]|nr:hypothetical protein [bacterium]